jgi:hypothetical protein
MKSIINQKSLKLAKLAQHSVSMDDKAELEE